MPRCAELAVRLAHYHRTWSVLVISLIPARQGEQSGTRIETFVVPGADVYYYAVWGSSSRDVWVAGYEGGAAHFDGTGWSAVVLPTDAIITALDGRCATDAWMVGEGGTILRLVPET